MGSAQVTPTTWRKSSFSNGTGGNCVEVALAGEGHDEVRYEELGAGHKADLGPLIALRDSKNPDGPRLYFTRSEFEAFRRGVVAGEFDDLR
ncbi:DUF397 domain-containing protein [Nonomuraea sp. K274]|uniref:DUF397 domain-containing protein n=1 Tax=Nonomuraea cypriaca TaxID=1187855 RepID=A0A931EZN4_9ACTN|nr:DUF397 domain-containing protein [Nonomuraea cypriaca]